MKRVMCTVIMLVMLIGAVPCIANGESESYANLLKTYNEETKETVYNIFRSLILKSLGSEDQERAMYAELMHWYYMMYLATNRLGFPLSQLRLVELAGGDSSTYTDALAKGQVELDEYDLEQWKNYLNGEISASDYMSHVIKMVGAMKNAEEQVQQDIDGTKK